MPPTFPHHYTASLTREGPSRAIIEAPPRPALAGAPPPEFDGPADRWSPEHLLLASLGLCFYTTFEAFAKRDRLEVASWRSSVDGVLDRGASGLAFTGFRIRVELAVAPADVERARALLDRARRHCIVSNSLRAPVEIEPTLTATPAAA